MHSSNGTSRLNGLISQIKLWITPPSFPDEDKTRRASTLNLILINILLLIPVLIAANLLGGNIPRSLIGVNITFFALFLVLYYLMRRGRIRLASIGSIALGLLGITTGIASLGTIRAPSTAMYLLIVIAAGLLFDMGGMVITIALCSLLVAGLIVLGGAGLLPAPDYSITITQWITYTAAFCWAGSLTFSALQSINLALARADRELSERKLAQVELVKHRDHLRELIKERTAELQDANEELEAASKELRRQNEELISAQSALQEREEHYRTLFNSMTEGFSLHEIICDDQEMPVDYRFLEVNPAFEQLTGLKRADIIGRTQKELFPGEDPCRIRDFGAVALTGKPARLESYSTAQKRHYEVFAYRPAPRQFAVLSTDITERKDAEEKLKASESRYRNLYESMMDAFVYVDKDGRIIEFNEVYRQMLGYEPDELHNLTYIDITPEKWHAFEAEVVQNQACVRGYTDIYEKEYRKKDGTILPIELRACLARDEQGNPNGLWGIVRDITNRKRAEERLIDSLQEKEVLLKEIHHRVKNNMQIIHSLLSIQANNIQDERAKEAIAECKDRVKSMALIHESLYRSENLAKVNFSGYISSLTRSLFSSFGVDRRQIKLSLYLEQVFLSIDKAIPCGLIVNELVSNCLKHAFPDKRQGMVQVELTSLDEDHNMLIIRDNGIGLPELIEPGKAKTLGLRLVTDLVKQIKGEIQIDHCSGTQFKIVFPADSLKAVGCQSRP